MKKEQVNKTLSNFIDAYDLLLRAIVDCNELTLEEKQKFGDVITGAIYECHLTIQNGNSSKFLKELEPINQKCFDDFDIN